jgi:hypothetical protein
MEQERPNVNHRSGCEVAREDWSSVMEKGVGSRTLS